MTAINADIAVTEIVSQYQYNIWWGLMIARLGKATEGYEQAQCHTCPNDQLTNQTIHCHPLYDIIMY